MSRADRTARRRRARDAAPRFAWADEDPVATEPEPSLRERLAAAWVPAFAILPLRLFFGGTFLYAGLDKLVDPAFLDAGNPASIQAQLRAFERVSPLAPLVRIGQPFAVELGVLIAVAEIAIGLGALSGLLFRVAAAGGAALSLLFWLTASWGTHPYYYGPDLPYAFGWIALALAGDGGLLVPDAVRRIGATVQVAGRGSRWATVEVPASPARRAFIQAAALGTLSLLVASFTVPLRLARPPATNGGTAGLPSDGPGGLPSDAPGTTPPPTSVPVAGQVAVAKVADVDRRGAVSFRVPASAPAPLPAGDPAVIVKLPDGTYVAYDAVCTHQGCRVGWDARDGVLLCPCHGAAFDATDHGAVLQGPTDVPLAELPIVVDPASGTISLRA